MEAEGPTADQDEAPILVDTAAPGSEEFNYSYDDIVEINEGAVHSGSAAATTKDDFQPVLAFGPNPTMEAKLSAVVQDESPLLVDATTENYSPDVAEQSETRIADEPSVSLPVADNAAPKETTDLPESADDEPAAEAVRDDGSDLGSVGSSFMESFDAVGVSDVAGTMRKMFGGMSKLLEYVQPEAGPADDVPKTGSPQKIVEIIEPTTQKPDREASLMIMTDKPGFVAAMLALPNGLGATMESHELEFKLVTLHVLAPELPLPFFNIQKKVKKTKKFVQGPIINANFVAPLLAMPNGPGASVQSRELHEKLITMHISPLQFPRLSGRSPRRTRRLSRL
jgi:hypothetical protein